MARARQPSASYTYSGERFSDCSSDEGSESDRCDEFVDASEVEHGSTAPTQASHQVSTGPLYIVSNWSIDDSLLVVLPSRFARPNPTTRYAYAAFMSHPSSSSHYLQHTLAITSASPALLASDPVLTAIRSGEAGEGLSHLIPHILPFQFHLLADSVVVLLLRFLSLIH